MKGTCSTCLFCIVCKFVCFALFCVLFFLCGLHLKSARQTDVVLDLNLMKRPQWVNKKPAKDREREKERGSERVKRKMEE